VCAHCAEHTVTIPILTTEQLRLDAFGDADIGALAAILAEPDVTRTITANGSTPEKCRASARHRIGWHNASWSERGYGVWAVRSRADNALIGWCGFAAPDIGADPEILYGLAPHCWGKGLAQEAVRAAIDWLFAETPHQGVSAVIFGRLNPVSAAIAGKLGMTKRGTMAMKVFLPDLALARDVLEYEIWRLGHGRTRDAEALLFQAPYKGGQIASLRLADLVAVEQLFCDAARARAEFECSDRAQTERRVRDAFRQGVAEPHLDWYHLDRKNWRA
jgi:RimJ/RimL family protein N-acetyltransferase